MVEDATSSEYVSLDGTKTVAGVDWPIYRARLSDTGDLSISFDASESYDPEYGARPLRRLLRRRLENPLATELLEERYTGARAVQVNLQEGALQFSPVL